MPSASLFATLGGALGLYSIFREIKGGERQHSDTSYSREARVERPRNIRQALELGSELIELWRKELFQSPINTYLAIRKRSRKDISREVAAEVRERGTKLEGPEWVPLLEEILRLIFLSRALAQSAHVKAPRRLEHFARSARIDQSEILACEFRASLHTPAFILLRDEELKALVLILRGSAEKADYFTSMTGMTQPHHIFSQVATDGGAAGSPSLGFAHSGFVVSAHRVLKHHLLNPSNPKLLEAVREQRNRGYRLLVCGHSLGAGIAALLTAFLREQSPELSHVQCVAFACPPCATKELAEACAPFVTTIVNSADAVPTISHRSIQDYKRSLAQDQQLRRADRPGRLGRALTVVGGGFRQLSRPSSGSETMKRSVGRSFVRSVGSTSQGLLSAITAPCSGPRGRRKKVDRSDADDWHASQLRNKSASDESAAASSDALGDVDADGAGALERSAESEPEPECECVAEGDADGGGSRPVSSAWRDVERCVLYPMGRVMHIVRAESPDDPERRESSHSCWQRPDKGESEASGNEMEQGDEEQEGEEDDDGEEEEQFAEGDQAADRAETAQEFASKILSDDSEMLHEGVKEVEDEEGREGTGGSSDEAGPPLPSQPATAEESEGAWDLYTDVDPSFYTRLRISRTMRSDHRQSCMESRLQAILERFKLAEQASSGV